MLHPPKVREATSAEPPTSFSSKTLLMQPSVEIELTDLVYSTIQEALSPCNTQNSVFSAGIIIPVANGWEYFARCRGFMA